MELVGDTTNQNGFGGQQQPPSMFQYPPPPYLVDHPSNYGRGPDQQSMFFREFNFTKISGNLFRDIDLCFFINEII